MKALNQEQFSNIRKTLHQLAELSGQEKNTSNWIKNFLEKDLKLQVQGIGKYGLWLSFKGKSPGPRVLFRADMDALPIPETLNIEHASKQTGISHKCGHDGHSTILIGLAAHLSQHPPHHGEIGLIFQPAEETGQGAAEMIKHLPWTIETIDFAYALHNLPGKALGEVFCKAELFTPHVSTCIMEWKGMEGHAATPELAHHPGKVLQFALNEFGIDQPTGFKSCPVYSMLGAKAYGTSPANAELHCTCRAKDTETFQSIVQEKLEKIERLSKDENLSFSYRFEETFYANINHAEAVETIQHACQKANIKYHQLTEAMPWGEDFGLFTQQSKGAMFGLGSGEDCPPLHHPKYDFPDQIIASGVKTFVEICKIHCA